MDSLPPPSVQTSSLAFPPPRPRPVTQPKTREEKTKNRLETAPRVVSSTSFSNEGARFSHQSTALGAGEGKTHRNNPLTLSRRPPRLIRRRRGGGWVGCPRPSRSSARPPFRPPSGGPLAKTAAEGTPGAGGKVNPFPPRWVLGLGGGWGVAVGVAVAMKLPPPPLPPLPRRPPDQRDATAPGRRVLLRPQRPRLLLLPPPGQETR